ncbi:TPA: DUF443 family protein [Staphylococcus aureus]
MFILICLYIIWWIVNNGSEYVSNFIPSNIIEFLALIGMTACFFLLNMSSVLDKKIHVILKTNK